LIAGENIVRLVKSCGVSDTRFCRACVAATNRLRLYAGVRETLAELEQRGTPCGVVTNLPGRLVNPLLEQLELAAYFQVVVHAGTVRPWKPNPTPLREAARMMRLGNVAGVFYIGDRPNDALATHRAGMRFAWAAYGYESACPDEDAVVLRDFRQVLDL
jgi:phosphoglycolate phosphatase-like HAD superfamily hydrolase